ncbi:hypothetical protein CC86DRAFT_416223 [Ophiobolus disseminans]|uniref:Heterokaryon incompatibility domain-containing protein n=1 Tax=Ophiobolus disseminans TaxID=1469910 RepID=A0A6A6ZZU0_9PLEO|nr:hypothetical protein CC86DRAFT_416223 [Ophiobolus disseminans]
MVVITNNLDVALRHLRYEDDARVLWIDALCIDQGLIEEKNRQVAAMGRVYSTAKLMIAWVGPEKDGSTEAVEIIKRVGRYVEIDWSRSKAWSSDDCPMEELHWSSVDASIPFEEGELDPVLDLFCRPYFNRAWIRQEVVLAARAILVCGNDFFDWETFRTVGYLLHSKVYYRTAFTRHTWQDFERIRREIYELCVITAGRLSYDLLRAYLSSAKCEDPRDKIFSILALLDPKSLEIGIQPDYAQDALTLYTDVAMRVSMETSSLRLLESCLVSARTLDIPSWVPDWSTPLPSTAPIEMGWSACSWITSNDLEFKRARCHATGISVQFVRRVVGPFARKGDPYTDTCKILHGLEDATSGLLPPNTNIRGWIELFCKSVLFGSFAESYFPPNTTRPTLQEFVDVIHLIMSKAFIMNASEEATVIFVTHHISDAWADYPLLVCDYGHVGLSHTGVQEGDVVSVLVGSNFPVILRSRPNPDDIQLWEVVSTAAVSGLMDGEAIYGNRLPLHWRAVTHFENCGDERGIVPIDGSRHGFYDMDTDTLKTNPAEILTEMGIEVERHQIEPHVLEVRPETLRAAGVPLREFILV